MKKKFSLLIPLLFAMLFCGCNIADDPQYERKEFSAERAVVDFADDIESFLKEKLTNGNYYYGHSVGLTYDTDFQFYFHKHALQKIRPNDPLLVTITAKGEIPWTIAYETPYRQWKDHGASYTKYDFGFNSTNDRDKNDFFSKNMFYGNFVENTFGQLDGNYIYVMAQTPSGKEFTILLEKVDKAVFQ